MYVLKLYVTGQTTRTERAIYNLYDLCNKYLADNYEITVIDVLEYPQLAEEEKILATPTVIRELPLPHRRLVGDLSDVERVLNALDLTVPLKRSEKDRLEE
ncbi:MAG: circadian clock protein KaiB [Candidatus Thermofonsia Clade 1 bacterium]|jgi:circadian clock protein KaiB|uniref:Circadian clock protein KaiB n=1 Tax=Candidatus Thermofonsia Clade 1 bacterium TaxID=2364210 RepID=A0A2M8P471_9CHLR|nr:MAG: circadian clock protein KaiB [Candidatus Thermofonsia Clade 1 bacterium]